MQKLLSEKRGIPIWLICLAGVLPVVIYGFVFCSISLNVNYLAFDDIIILEVLKYFPGASLTEKWKQLTRLFPEHRLIFSRSVILTFYNAFGRIDLVWLTVIANICWAGCAFLFYKVFRKTRLPVLYFLPVLWIWFNIQSFENIFWGVSSLCNFGVLLFVIASLYCAIYKQTNIFLSLFFAVAATFTYGNGLMVFPIIGLLCLLTGHRVHFFITTIIAGLIAVVYFTDFSPITRNIDLANPAQVKDGVLGFFGFVGSIATSSAYDYSVFNLQAAVVSGVLIFAMAIFILRKEWMVLLKKISSGATYTNRPLLFGLSLGLFIAITALAVVYKRIPTDHFEGMFKGRYRMYSTLALVALYFLLLSVSTQAFLRKYIPVILLIAVCLNLLILHGNFADAVNNRRQAVVQEFNARYNKDWLGLQMFDMTQAHFEEIRKYYNSADPLAENWQPLGAIHAVRCGGICKPDTVMKHGEYIIVNFNDNIVKKEKDYTDGEYVMLKSADHVYASSPNEQKVPLKTTIRRQMYFSKGVFASFHEANIEPGQYTIFLLVRENGINRMYCTNKIWNETR